MKNSSHIKELATYLLAHKNKLAMVLIALISVTISVLSIGTAFRYFIDQGLSAGHEGVMNKSALIIGALIMVFAAGSFLRSYYINSIALEVTSKLKYDAYSNLLKSELKAFEDLKVGDIIARLGADIDSVKSMIVNFLSFFIRNIIMLIGAISLMFLQSPKLSLLTLASIPLMLLPIIGLSRSVKRLSRQVVNKQGLCSAYIEENITGIRTLHAYNRQHHQIDLFKKQISDFNLLANLRLKYRSLFFALTISIIAIAIIAIIWIGSMDILKGKITSGNMVSFIYYAVMSGLSAGGIMEMFSEIQGPLAALERIMQIKHLKNTKSNHGNKNVDLIGDISFQNITFAYPTRPNNRVLNDISLTCKQGDFTAIVGRSGSGKSTLMQLLVKFYEFDKGKITINNQDIKLINNHAIHDKIAYVEQNPTIFSGSILDNILFAKPNATKDELKNALDICDIHSFTDNLEHGIKTQIGEKGVRLSGGQKQRISIARAILHKPEVFLLDEATSALDSASEKDLLSKLSENFKTKSIISISHRISSIENADNILVVDQGKIVENGTHKQLIKKSTIYNLLYKQQRQIFD